MPDFRIQPNAFPIASYVDAAQRAAQMKQQARAQESESFISGMKAIGEVGESIHAQKQKVAQALALAKATGVDEKIARTMSPDQVLAIAKIQKGYEDQDAFIGGLRSLYNLPGSADSAKATSTTPTVAPSSFEGRSPEHQMGATLAHEVSGTPIPEPTINGGGLPPATTTQVPIQAPPVMGAAPVAEPQPTAPKKISPQVQKLLVKYAENHEPHNVYQYTPGKGLTSVGQKKKGEQVITSQSGVGTSWANATPEQQALAIARYEGRLRSGDIGFRERSLISSLAEQYPTLYGLPKFNAYAADTNAAMARYSTSGKMGQNALSLNTALGHLSDAYDSYQAIGNTNQKWLNTPINVLKKETNDPEVVALGLNLNALQGELANVFKNTGATDQEIAHWRDYLNTNLTPSQYVGAAEKIDGLLRSRLNAMEYQRAGARGSGGAPLISPHGKDISQKMEQLKTNKPDTGPLPGFSAENERRLQMLLEKKKNGTIKS